MRGQFVRFAMAGAVGFLADIGVLFLALAAGFGYFSGRLASFLAAVWLTWRINRRFTFAASGGGWREWWRYLAAMSGGGCVNYAVYSLAVIALERTPWLPVYAVALGSAAGMAFNFVTAKHWVFKHG